jgi:FkbM family methyltransferase
VSEFRSQARVIQNGNPFADAARRRGDARCVETILDVGANVGDVVAHLLANFPRGVVHAFEPNPADVATLRDRYEFDPRVVIAEVGVSSAVGTATLHRFAESGLNALSGLSPASTPFLEGYGTTALDVLEVPVTTLDAYCAGAGIESVDFLKLDVQGWEIPCLEGAADLLAARRIGAVYCEVNFVELYERQHFFDEITAHLRAAGYDLFSLYALSFNAEDRLCWADALYLPRA